MKILFDQGTPVPLRRQLPEHTLPRLLNKAGLLYQTEVCLTLPNRRGLNC